MTRNKSNSTQMKQIKRISADRISEDQSDQLNQRSIPKHWSWVKLGDIINKIPTTGKKLKQKEYLSDGKHPVVDQGQELIGGYTNEKNLLIDFEPPVIVFGDHTKVKKLVNFKFVPGADGIKVIKPFDKFDTKLFYYFLHCIKIPDKGYARHFQFVEKAEIPLPPLPEQKKIVAKIEELFSELDNGIDQLVKAKEQLRVYRQSVLSYAFRGKLVRQRAEGKGQREILKAARQRSSDSKESDGLFERGLAERRTEPGVPYNGNGLPEGWKWVKVKDICKKIVGGGTPSTKVTEYWNGDIDWITSADIYGIKDIKPRKKINEKAIENSATNLLPKGNIVVVTRVGLGKLAINKNDLCFSQDSQGLILNKGIVFNEFALWYLSNAVQVFKYKNRGTTINGVTKKQLAELDFLLPPKEKQHQIVSEIESRFSVADKLEQTIDENLSKSETLRQSILKKAFEGKLI